MFLTVTCLSLGCDYLLSFHCQTISRHSNHAWWNKSSDPLFRFLKIQMSIKCFKNYEHQSKKNLFYPSRFILRDVHLSLNLTGLLFSCTCSVRVLTELRVAPHSVARMSIHFCGNEILEFDRKRIPTRNCTQQGLWIILSS